MGSIGGAYSQVALNGNLAIISVSGFPDQPGILRILDVSDPSRPTPVSDLTELGYVDHFVVSGSFIYSLSYEGLYATDISDPVSPKSFQVMPRSQYGYDDRIAADGSRLYVIRGSWVGAYDVSDPTNPRFAGSLTLWSTHGIDVVASGTTAFVLDSSAGVNGQHVEAGFFQIVDFSNPLTPFVLGGYNLPTDFTPQGMKIWGPTAYFWGEDDSGAGRIRILDFTNPFDVEERGSIELPSVSRIEVRGSMIYACTSQGLSVIDASNPDAPVAVKSIPLRGDAVDSNLNGNLLAIAEGPAGLELFDVSDPISPVDAGSYDAVYLSFVVKVVDHTAYVTTSDGFLKSIDISNPAYPHVLASVPLTDMLAQAFFGALEVSDAGLVVSDGNSLRIVDVSNPSAPRLRGLYHDSEWFVGLSTRGAIAYGTNETQFLVVDCANPDSPYLRSALDISGLAGTTSVTGNFVNLYETAEKRLEIIDVSNPDHPQLRASYPLGLEYVHGTAGDGLAVLAGRGQSIVPPIFIYPPPHMGVLSLSDPIRPTILSEFGPSYETLGMKLSNKLLYVVENSIIFLDSLTQTGPGVRIYNLGYPETRVEVGSFPGGFFGLDVHDRMIYTVGYSGFSVLEYTGSLPVSSSSRARNEASITRVNLPKGLHSGSEYAASFTIQNRGDTTWNADSGYRLRVVEDACGFFGGVRNLDLPRDASVEPGRRFTFTRSLHAPDEESRCIVRLQMVEELDNFFGPEIERKISVTGSR